MDINTLFSNCRQGGKAAEEALFAALTARFRLFAEQKVRNRVDADEIVQNALMVVFKKYRAIDFEISFAAWAHRVLENEILKYYRAKSYHNNLFMQVEPDASPSALWHPDPTLKRRVVDCMKKICEANARYARTLNLKHQGYGTDDICRKLEISPENFYVILSRARSMLKLCLETGVIR